MKFFGSYFQIREFPAKPNERGSRHLQALSNDTKKSHQASVSMTKNENPHFFFLRFWVFFHWFSDLVERGKGTSNWNLVANVKDLACILPSTLGPSKSPFSTQKIWKITIPPQNLTRNAEIAKFCFMVLPEFPRTDSLMQGWYTSWLWVSIDARRNPPAHVVPLRESLSDAILAIFLANLAENAYFAFE